jgi:hypothetical protein
MTGGKANNTAARRVRFMGPPRLARQWRTIVASTTGVEPTAVVPLVGGRSARPPYATPPHGVDGHTHGCEVALNGVHCLQLSERWIREGWNTRLSFMFPNPYEGK